MKIAVCDDNRNDRESIKEYILLYARKNYLDIKVDAFENGEDFLKQYRPGHYEVVFLDIYMGGITGIQAAQKIRAGGDDCIIIFSTISMDHALSGYSVQALYYVVKPVEYIKIETALNLCKKQLIKNSSYIEVMSNKMKARILLKDIYYIEVYGKTSIIHNARDAIKTYMPLDELEGLLGGEPFYRCHRSYIVNMDYVKNIDDSDFVLTNGDRVPIRKAGKSEAKLVLANYLVK